MAKPSGEFETVAELIENQAHEEKNGYKFCGYFEDEAFSKRVETAIESVEDAEKLYPYDSVLRGYYDFVLGYGEDEEIK